MKNILNQIALLCVLVFLLPLSGFTQTLENRYSNLTTNYFKFSGTEDGYVEFDQKNNVIRVYDINHSLQKSVQLASSVSIYLVSKTIINNDGKFKFVVSSNSQKNVSIIDEDNNILFKRDSASIAKFINTSNGPKMLLLSTTGAWTEVYSIPGSVFLKLANPSNNLFNLEIYPNPASLNTTIRLNSNQQEGQLIDLEILNLQGQLVRQSSAQVSNGEISISVEGIDSGEYLIKLNPKNSFSIYKKVIVN